MNRFPLIKKLSLFLLVGITLLCTIAANPPLSPRGQEYKGFVQDLIPKATESGGLTVLGVTVSTVNGVDLPTTFRIEGPNHRLQSLRLAELAREANLFDAIPSTAVPSPADPIVEITITGADKRFFYRAKRKDLTESIKSYHTKQLSYISITYVLAAYVHCCLMTCAYCRLQ